MALFSERPLRAVLGVTLATALVLASGCASRGRRTSSFPSRAQLEEIEEAPLPSDLLSDAVDVSEWTLAGPLPEGVELVHHAGQGSWDALLREAIAHRPGSAIPTAAMQCAAREVGSFLLEHDALPSQTLHQYFLSRCGALAVSVMPAFLSGEVRADAEETEIRDRWRDSVLSLVAEHLGSGLRSVGLWFGRRDERGYVLFLSGARRVDVEPFVPVPDADGKVVIRGTLLEPAESIHAMVNRGAYGYADCEADPSVALPEFELVCTVDPDDATTVVQVSSLPPGRILGDEVLDLLVRREGEVAGEYRKHRYAPVREVRDVLGFRSAIVHAVNRVRAQAGLAPVVLAKAQSETSERLVPHFFAARAGQLPPQTLDLIVLGLVAGWDVEGTIRHGSLTFAGVGPTLDIGRWLSAALGVPSGRSVLLNPEVRKIALGPILSEEPPFLGAVVTGYSFFDAADHGTEAEHLYTRLAGRRKALGLSAPHPIRALAEDAEDCARQVESGVLAPQEALQEFMERGVRVLRRSVQGLLLESNDLEAMPFPDALLKPGRLDLAIAVTHYQPEEEPWGRYVLLIAVAGPRSVAGL